LSILPIRNEYEMFDRIFLPFCKAK
jgi:hypothetical protein